MELEYISESEKNLIPLAIDEACANCIIHGNKSDECQTLDIEISSINNEVVIKITDTGKFSPDFNTISEKVVTDAVENGQSGGLGLFIISEVMDSVEFQQEKNTNFCLMRKKLVLKD